MRRFLALCPLAVLFCAVVLAQGVTGSGTAVIIDGQSFSDSLRLTMTDVTAPSAGMRYYAWLMADNDASFKRLGALTVSSGSVSFGYLDATQENLIANYKKFLITEEVDGFAGMSPTLDKTVFAGALHDGPGTPGANNALSYVRNAVAAFNTPQGKGLLVWLLTQFIKSDNFVQHAGFAASSTSIEGVKVHADHVYDFVQGQLTGLIPNGSVASNGDPLGYGFYRYGDLSTRYTALGGAGHHVAMALAQSDATQEMVTEGNNALTSLRNVFGLDNMSGWAKEVTDQCLKILQTSYSSLAAAQADGIVLVGLANKVEHGTGGPGNDDPAVGGVRTAYRRAQVMATYVLSPVVTSVSAGESGLPLEFWLQQNFPNPFNPGTTIAYTVPDRNLVSLKVFDLLGREVATLVSEIKEVGQYSVSMDATHWVSGAYLYRLEAGSKTLTKKMIFVK